jgi:hypothetical protein
MTFTDWVITLFIIGSLLFATVPDAHAHESGHWFKSSERKPAITKAEVVEVAKFDKRCSDLYTNSMRGCYIPEKCDPLYPTMSVFCIPGRIEIAMYLPPWVKECIIKHERKHEEGYDHTHNWSDCW